MGNEQGSSAFYALWKETQTLELINFYLNPASCVDKAGEQVPEEPETPDPPVKKLKRRNMAMYTPDDN